MNAKINIRCNDACPFIFSGKSDSATRKTKRTIETMMPHSAEAGAVATRTKQLLTWAPGARSSVHCQRWVVLVFSARVQLLPPAPPPPPTSFSCSSELPNLQLILRCAFRLLLNLYSLRSSDEGSGSASPNTPVEESRRQAKHRFSPFSR